MPLPPINPAPPAPRPCVVIPAFREEAMIARVVADTLPFCPDVIVVDDGSPDGTAEIARAAGATVLQHVRNQGKGMALFTGFQYAREHGFGLVITMDGDGQHAPADIPAFLAAYERTHVPCIVGSRMDDTSSMPWLRRVTNRYMSHSLSRLMRAHVPDTQCGFRLYHVSVLPTEPPSASSRHFAAESEVLLKIALAGHAVGSVPIQTIYSADTTHSSKIRPLADTFRYYRMLRQFKKLRRNILRKQETL